MPVASINSVEPDATVIRAHLERLFGRARTEYPGGLVEIAWSNGGAVNAANLFPITPSGLDEAASLAAEKSREDRNVYVGVNPRKPETPPFGRANRSDVEIAFFHFVDGDTVEAAQRIMTACPLPYTFAVTTGRVPSPRPHVYWELEEPTRNMRAWEEQQRALASHFKGDAVIDPPRIMRLAGTVNYPSEKKVERGYAVEQVTLRTTYEDERPAVSTQQLAQAYPPIVPPPVQPLQTAQPAYDPETGEVYETDNVVRLFKPEGIDPLACIRSIDAGANLHNNARDLAAHMVGAGYPDWLIRELLTRALRPVSDGGTLGQVPKLIGSARQKFQMPDPGVEAPKTAGHAGPLPIIWFKDIEANTDTTDFVEGVLCDGQMSVVYGESNCGKTFFMTDLGLHVAWGRAWRGREVERGGVIYCALEGGHGIKNRLAAFRKAHGLDGVDLPFAVVPVGMNLLDPKADVEKLIMLIREAAQTIKGPIKLIVIDTLSRALAGGNENAPDDMGALVGNADRVRQATGAHLCFVHHSGKDQARGARGHSLLRAATDTEIEVIKIEGANQSVATVNKQRELEIEGEFAFSLKQIELGENRRKKPVSSCIVVEAEMNKSVMESRQRLTPKEHRAREILRNVLADQGIPAPKDRNIPNVTVARIEAFRAALRVTRVTEEPNERMQWQRIKDGLDNKGFIRMHGDFIWLP